MNALKELLNEIKIANSQILCCEIKHEKNRYKLLMGYDEYQYSELLKSLDFEYDEIHGSQELFGTIWFQNGTWSTRWENQGDEGWEHHTVPEIPDYLR
jgi:hypothetical protein